MSEIRVALEKEALTPGETIAGTVTWKAGQVDAIRINLIWYTQGKGDMDHHTVESQSVPHPSSFGSHRFSFNLPESPYSFSGKLLSLIWAVEVFLEPSDESDRREFTLSPNGREVVLT